jgi:hypothetical protein
VPVQAKFAFLLNFLCLHLFIKKPLANVPFLSIGSTMRIAALVFAIMVFQSTLLAETAYEAIRTVQGANGDAILERVVEVRGKSGTPQPKAWQVVLDDPLARGGVRVMEVKGGKVVGERTPVTGYASEGVSSLIQLSDLNLDSSGAFAAVEKAAVKQQVGFNKVDYSLRLKASSRTPTWFITLYDVNENEVGSVQISAREGTIVAETWAAAAVPNTNDRDYVQSSGQVGTQENSEGKSETEKVVDSLENFGQRAKRHFLRDAAAVQRFFTGKSTLDEEDR